MKSDVAMIGLKETRKVSYAEGALIAVILVIATKFCTLPSVLAGIAESKAVWAAAILTALELVTAFFALKTAKGGGLPALDLPRGVKYVFYLFFALFFALKLAAFTREISTYYALSLFENVPVLPVMVLLLVACSVIARKEYAAIGRMLELFIWLFVAVFFFIVIFTRTEGDLFNALAMFSPDTEGLGKGIAAGAAWQGDSAMLAFLDLRGEERFSPHATGANIPQERTKAKRRIAILAALFSLLAVVLFYAVFTAAYGDVAKMTDYAFIKLTAFRANTDELGSADWPVIILWSVVTTVYLTLLLISGRECLYGLVSKDDAPKKSVIPFFLLGGSALLFALFFLGEEGDYQDFMTKIGFIPCFLAVIAAIGLGIYVLAKRKGEKYEE